MLPETESVNRSWYALKVFFNKVFEISSYLDGKGLESWFPTETVYIFRDGHRRKVLKPVISSLVFFRGTRREALERQRELDGRVILYTHRVGYRKEPSAIPEDEMERFRIVATSGEEGLEFFSSDSESFRQGEHVQVIDGPFKGAEGWIKRIKGDHRLFVSIRGVCAVATSYIPRMYLKKL